LHSEELLFVFRIPVFQTECKNKGGMNSTKFFLKNYL